MPSQSRYFRQFAGSLGALLVILCPFVDSARALDIPCYQSTCSPAFSYSDEVQISNLNGTIDVKIDNWRLNQDLTVAGDSGPLQNPLALLIENKTTLGHALSLDMSAKNTTAPGRQTIVISDVIGSLNLDVSGYKGQSGKDASQLCASKILASELGDTWKNYFNGNRLSDQTLPLDRCTQAEVYFIQSNSFSCPTGTVLLDTKDELNPSVKFTAYRKSNKCVTSFWREYCSLNGTFSYTTAFQTCAAVGKNMVNRAYDSIYSFDDTDTTCTHVPLNSYDPSGLTSWLFVGKFRDQSFGQEAVTCNFTDCDVIRQNKTVDSILATLSPGAGEPGTNQGSAAVLAFDTGSASLSSQNGLVGPSGKADIAVKPDGSVSDTYVCSQVLDLSTSTSYGAAPEVHISGFHHSAFKMAPSGNSFAPPPLVGNRIQIFKKLDPSVRYFFGKRLGL